MPLFSKAKKDMRDELLKFLQFVVAGTQAAPGYAKAPATVVANFRKYEPTLMETVGEVDPSGVVDVRATAAGIAALQPGASTDAKPEPATKSTFVLETGFVPPATKRGGVRESAYPFSSMELGHSFLVPATAEKPLAKLAKSMASTVSGVNKRYLTTYPANHKTKAGQPTGKDGRKFTVRARTVADQEKVEGVRVYRIA